MTTYLPYWTSKENSGEYKNFETFKMCFEMTIDSLEEKYDISLDTKVDIIDGVFVGSVSLASFQRLADKGHYVSKVILEKFNKGELKAVPPKNPLLVLSTIGNWSSVGEIAVYSEADDIEPSFVGSFEMSQLLTDKNSVTKDCVLGSSQGLYEVIELSVSDWDTLGQQLLCDF